MKKNTHLKRKNSFTAFIIQIFVAILPFVFTTLQAQTQINNYCFNSTVVSMAKSPDGGIFVGGYFTNVAEYCGKAIKLDPANTPS